jgi:hypothetical protein
MLSAVPCLAASPAGNTIVLPQKLVAAQPATLAVLDADGRLLPGATLEFSGGVRLTTDSTGRATFRAPRQPGVFFVKLAEGSVTASSTVVAPPELPPDGVQVVRLPRVALLGEAFEVSGSGFRGEADANQVQLGEQPAVVLAASPVSLVVLPGPASLPGPVQFLLTVDGRSPGPVPIRLVTLELVLEKSRLGPGERSRLRVRARGSEERLQVEVRNLTPGVVRLPEGDLQRVTTSGGVDNSIALRVEGIRSGDYSIGLRLIRAAAGLPDTEACRHHLLAARELAPETWRPRVSRVIALLEENPQNALRARNELEKMLAEQPEGEFGRRLEAAWRALL